MPVPSYPKVLTFGAHGTEHVLEGAVSVQEKADGSQFGFGVENGELVFRSHGAQLYPESAASIFKPAIDHLLTKQDYLLRWTEDAYPIYLYAEVIAKPKHNVLTYAKTPKGGMVLFDICANGTWIRDHAFLEIVADNLEVDFIHPLYEGSITRDELLKMLADLEQQTSYLGGTPPEGLVIKNYDQNINLGGNVWPVFAKLVRPQFKEKHAKEWNVGGPTPLQSFMDSLKNDTSRWQKAVMHLQEQGEIEGSPRDIGKLINFINDDVVAEEKQAIMEKLWALFVKDIKRAASSGFPEWYKAQLAQGVSDDTN